jgi:hypothetical protein
MEEHRLTPMPKGFNEEVFHDIYRKTEELRKKLTYQIDHRRYGVEQEDIKSWFDVKFIFTFNKYHKEKPEILKAYIINSLQFFKNRILRYSYSQKNSINRSSVDIDEVYNCQELIDDRQYDETSYYLELATNHLKNNLSQNAYRLLQVELNPPTYILKRLVDKQTTTKIPSKLIAEYLGLKESDIPALKKEIQFATYKAKEHFANV